MSADPHPVTRFHEPWQAQLFALTVALNEAGALDWGEWTEAFGATLARNRAAGNSGKDTAEDTGPHMGPHTGEDDAYFDAWLETLETVIAGREAGLDRRLAGLREGWRAAYLATPHGAPVRLETGMRTAGTAAADPAGTGAATLGPRPRS